MFRLSHLTCPLSNLNTANLVRQTCRALSSTAETGSENVEGFSKNFRRRCETIRERMARFHYRHEFRIRRGCFAAIGSVIVISTLLVAHEAHVTHQQTEVLGSLPEAKKLIYQLEEHAKNKEQREYFTFSS